MPTSVLTPYKLTKTQKKSLLDYIEGRKGIGETCRALGVPNNRVYVMVVTIARHAASTGSIDVKELLKKY